MRSTVFAAMCAGVVAIGATVLAVSVPRTGPSVEKMQGKKSQLPKNPRAAAMVESMIHAMAIKDSTQENDQVPRQKPNPEKDRDQGREIRSKKMLDAMQQSIRAE